MVDIIDKQILNTYCTHVQCTDNEIKIPKIKSTDVYDIKKEQKANSPII